MEKEVKPFREEEYYRERIIEMVKGIKNKKIIKCIFVFVSDISEEDREVK